MSRLFPSSLFGQTLLVLLAGLIVSHAVGSWIYTADREQAVRAVGGFATAQRIANLTRLVQDTPHEARQRIVAALSDQSFRVSLSAQPIAPPSVDGDDASAARAIKDFLVDQLSLGAARQPRVSASAAGGPPFGPWHGMGHGPMMRGFGGFAGFRDLQVSIPLADGPWLSFATALPAGGPAFSAQFLVSMAVMAIIILAVSVWAVRRVTAPLASLATAAERLGHDVNAPPLPEAGTTETRLAARAFNDMQSAIAQSDREPHATAGSHLARSAHASDAAAAAGRDRRERAGAGQDAGDHRRDGFHDRGHAGVRPRSRVRASPQRKVDLTSLLQSIVDDMSDAGVPVRMEAAEPIFYECQPAALKRAVRNLLDNAVKYGKAGSASIRPVLARRSRSISMTTARESPRRSSRACSSRSTGSRNRAAARPAGSAWAWLSLSRSYRLTVVRSR